jgi:hypothetical protein
MHFEFGLKLSRRFGLNLSEQKAAFTLSGYVHRCPHPGNTRFWTQKKSLKTIFEAGS